MEGAGPGGPLGRLAAVSARNGRLTVAIAGALAVAGVALALLTMGASGGAGTLADGSASRATADLKREFGEDPVYVLVQGRLPGMLLTQDLARMLSLEGCLAGSIPRGAKSPSPACRYFTAERPVRAVYGPGTFVNEAAERILDEIGLSRTRPDVQARRAARAARRVAKARGLSRREQDEAARRATQLVYSKFGREALQLALRFGLNSAPALNNPDFVLRLVFEPRLGADVPKPRFAYVFPDRNSALIQVRLRAGLDDDERREAIGQIKDATDSGAFRLKYGAYTVSGAPVVESTAAAALDGAAVVTALAAAALVAVVLALGLGVRRRLVPLAASVAGAAIAMGLAALAGIDLSAGTAAAPAVVVGVGAACVLAIHAAYGAQAGRHGPERAAASARAAGPAALIGVLLAAAGLAALLVSPAPLARDLGLTAAAGALLAFGVAVTAGLAAAAATFAPPAKESARARGTGRRTAPAPAALARARRAAGTVGHRAGAAGRAATGFSTRRPGLVLALAAVLAALGVAAGSSIEPEPPLERLLPSGSAASQDASKLRAETGSSGDVSVLVRARDLADPGVLAWMARYQDRVARRHGYRPGRPCSRADLCPALSLTGLVGDRPPRTRRQARALLEALPPSFSRNTISRDSTTANVAFRLGGLPLERRAEVIDDMRSQLDPPRGVSAELAGVAVVEADLASDLRTTRWVLGLVAIAGVVLVLLAAGRGRPQALVPALPGALAVGWVWLGAYALGIPLDPLTAGLGAVAAGVSALLAVWLYDRSSRERAERPAAIAGAGGGAALSPAVPAAAAVLGFAALAATDVRMLRGFGAAAALGLAISLAGVALVLPAALAWAQEQRHLRVPRSRAEAAAALRGARDRTAAGASSAAATAKPVTSAAAKAAAAGARRTAAAVRHAAAGKWRGTGP